MPKRADQAALKAAKAKIKALKRDLKTANEDLADRQTHLKIGEKDRRNLEGQLAVATERMSRLEHSLKSQGEEVAGLRIAHEQVKREMLNQGDLVRRAQRLQARAEEKLDAVLAAIQAFPQGQRVLDSLIGLYSVLGHLAEEAEGKTK